MECAQVGLEARPAAEERNDGGFMVANEGKGGRMVASELEAAETLAGLARCSAFQDGALCSGEVGLRLVAEQAVNSILPSEDQLIAAPQFCGHASTMVSNPEKSEAIVQNIPSELFSTSCQSNSAKFRRNLTEAEKEARKLRRVLANRESARQTIRHKQAMYLELTRKATDLLEENENLKKEKELSVEKHNSLKSGNEFLKAQLAKVKKVKQADKQKEPKTSDLDKSGSAATSTPVFLLEQPSTVPCFWLSIIPSLHVFQSQCASHPNFKIWPQFPVPHTLPVPWSLSFLARCTLDSNSGLDVGENAHQCGACSCSGYTLHEDNNQLSSKQNENGRLEASNPLRSMSRSNKSLFSAPESMRNGLLQKDRETIIRSHRKPEDVFAATEARRRRKELMKLKQVYCHPGRRRH